MDGQASSSTDPQQQHSEFSSGSGSIDQRPSTLQEGNIIQQFAEMAARATSGEGISENTFRRAYSHARDEVLRGRAHVTISMPSETNEQEVVNDDSSSDDTLAADGDGSRSDNRDDPQSDFTAQYSRLRVHLQNNRDAQTVYALISAFIPFLLLFILKGFIDYWKYIGMLVWGGALIICTERTLLKIVSGELRASSVGRRCADIALSMFLISTYQLILTRFYDMQYVSDAFTFQITGMVFMSFGETLYAIVITDLCSKVVITLLKTVVAIIPEKFLAIKRRRRVFQLFEYTSQMYRSLLPIPRWSLYFLGPTGYTGTPYTDYLLLITYLALKVREVLTSYTPLVSAAKMLFRSSGYGTIPTSEELAAEDPKCSICLDEMKSPIKLICDHVFCESCLDKWLDEKHTCPMCRATVDQEDNTWKSGATSKQIRLY